MELTLENFKKYETKTTFIFPPNGLVLLQGASGIGKTSKRTNPLGGNIKVV